MPNSPILIDYPPLPAIYTAALFVFSLSLSFSLPTLLEKGGYRAINGVEMESEKNDF